MYTYANLYICKYIYVYVYIYVYTYSGRRISNTIRSSNKTACTSILGASLVWLGEYPTFAMKPLALPSNATTSTRVIVQKAWHAVYSATCCPTPCRAKHVYAMLGQLIPWPQSLVSRLLRSLRILAMLT